MQRVRNIKSLPVDISAITDGLSSLMLPSQKPMFSQDMYVDYIFMYVFVYVCARILKPSVCWVVL